MNAKGKKIAILGCGYLGQRVARQALERGMQVATLTRNPARNEELGRLGVHQVIQAEIDQMAWHSLLDPRQDLVLNCVSSAGGGMEGYRKSYVEGMRSVLRWAEGGEVGTLVFTSSTSVYGQDGDAWVDEEEAAEGASEGGQILREAEVLLGKAARTASRRLVLRLGGIYGPGRQWLVNRAMGGEAPEEGDHVFLNSIHVEDAASSVWAAWEGGVDVQEGVFNIVDNQPTRKGEIIRFLHRRLKERGLLPTASSPLPPTRRRASSRPSRRLSNAKARRLLGWNPAYPNYQAGYEEILATLAASTAE
jgi:nucleoside-diphosphate-sugar epimerase